MNTIYFDNSATTKPCETAVLYVNKAVCENWGNPSSLHRLGINAESTLTSARSLTADVLSCKTNEIFFTSGGTESNNIAIKGAAYSLKRRGRRIVTTTIEHPSVIETVKSLEAEGFEVVWLKPDTSGNIPLESIKDAINSQTILVSMMLVNNETGAILPVEKIRGIVEANNAPALIHCDAVQAFGKMQFTVKSLGVDLISISAHKIHGIKGCGILYKSEKARLMPTVFGGNQESGVRSGTEPTPAIAGLLGALEELDVSKALTKVSGLNEYARNILLKTPGVTVNSPDNALPYILNISLNGYRSETVLHFLETKGIYVSSGSACSKGKGSYVLNEMALPHNLVDSALRISFSKHNTNKEVDLLAEALLEARASLRSSDRGSALQKLRRR